MCWRCIFDIIVLVTQRDDLYNKGRGFLDQICNQFILKQVRNSCRYLNANGSIFVAVCYGYILQFEIFIQILHHIPVVYYLCRLVCTVTCLVARLPNTHLYISIHIVISLKTWEIYLFYKSSNKSLGSIQLRSRWVVCVLSLGFSGQGVMPTTHLHPTASLIMSGSISLRPIYVFVTWTDPPLYFMPLYAIWAPIRWPHGLMRGCAAARLLGLWVQNPPGAWMLSFVIVVCCQVEVSATGWSFDQRSPIECGVSECECWSLDKDSLVH